MSIKEEIIDYLESVGVNRDIACEKQLFSSGILDSIDVIGLISFIEKKYAVSFNPFDIGLSDFDTVDAIILTIEKNRAACD